MPQKLTTTVNKIATVLNSVNAAIIEEFYQYMKSTGTSEHHQNNNLKVVIAFAKFLGSDTTFHDIQRKEQITRFLDTKAKPLELDPEKKWITTWNHYLHRIKLFMRKNNDDASLNRDMRKLFDSSCSFSMSISPKPAPIDLKPISISIQSDFSFNFSFSKRILSY